MSYTLKHQITVSIYSSLTVFFPNIILDYFTVVPRYVRLKFNERCLTMEADEIIQAK